MAKQFNNKSSVSKSSRNTYKNNIKRKSNGMKLDSSSKTKREDESYEGRNSNDLSWHAKSAQLLKDCASVPWSWATGKPIIRKRAGSAAKSNYYIPGICALRTITVPGVGTEPTDAINIAAQALYTDIRRELKSANAYEGSDVMIYMLAVADIIAMISWMTRLYATTMLYSFSNAYLPDELLRMQNVNPTDLHNRATEFRSRINQLIAKASQIWIPKGFDFITRARWIYSGYYSEGDSIKDQVYMFTPGVFRKFVLMPESDYAGGLEPFVPIPKYTDDEHAFSVDNLCSYLEEMINALVGDSDFQNIAGDLFNRYGSGGVETFSLIPEDAITFPTMSEEVLEQFMNAKCLSIYRWAFKNIEDEDYIKYFTVYQDEATNTLKINNVINATFNESSTKQDYLRAAIMDSYDPILSVHKEPSDSKTMLITRLTNSIIDQTVNTSDFTVTATVDVASEIVVGLEYGYYTDTGFNVVEKGTSISLDANGWYIPSAFHYYPITNVYNTTFPVNYCYGEQDIVAPITSIQLKDINRVDLMSLLAVPDVGKVTK